MLLIYEGILTPTLCLFARQGASMAADDRVRQVRETGGTHNEAGELTNGHAKEQGPTRTEPPPNRRPSEGPGW